MASAKHPVNDRGQVVFALVFFVVWGLDSFVLHFLFNIIGLFLLFVSVPVGVVSLFVGVYLVRRSESAVFNNKEGRVIDTGVYSWVRHPMYLGSLLILLGFSVATLSVLSLIVLAVFFVFLDRMATYEEKNLTKILGQQYIDYQKKVAKWIPYKNRN